jgi:hypothetical protein
MVLADLGGEPLKRIGTELPQLFKTSEMVFIWNGRTYQYEFQKILSGRGLDNKSLHVDGPSLVNGTILDSCTEDVIMLLLFGSAVMNAALPQMIGEKCMIGTLIGKTAELEKFVKQRYIFVSRITAGATSNSLGQIAQDYVCAQLRKGLQGWTINRNGTIPGISHNAGNTNMTFDVVAKAPSQKCFAIEVTYQVTTNSVIERKAGQAQSRQQLLHQSGHKISYVIYGAGNFEREAALRTICQFSDCTVAFTPEQLQVLIQFLIMHA